jgi:integration host factor subunit beta
MMRKKFFMTKSELIEAIVDKQDHLTSSDVELAVKMVLEKMANTLCKNQRIEIRGFGSFCLHHRAPRLGRNPKTGVSVELPSRSVPYFKPGKELRTRGNNSK